MIRLLMIGIVFALSLQAGEVTDDTIRKMDEADKIAAEGKKILLDPKRRQEASNSSPEAQAATKTIKKLAGNAEVEQQLYLFAADIMQSLTKKTKGDTKKMESMLREALTNPEGFANQFTPEQRKMLRDLANQISGSEKALH